MSPAQTARHPSEEKPSLQTLLNQIKNWETKTKREILLYEQRQDSLRASKTMAENLLI